MLAKLPPLKALRAFEAAFRHESFVAAARELNVTPSAVSHQIKLLEDILGLPLFRRAVRAVVPTAAARAAYPGVRRGFEELAGAMARIRPPKAGPLVLSCVPSFAMKWLIPRLDRRPAGLQVQIVATRDRADLIAGDADMAIRFGMGNYPGLDAHRLFDEMVAGRRRLPGSGGRGRPPLHRVGKRVAGGGRRGGGGAWPLVHGRRGH